MWFLRSVKYVSSFTEDNGVKVIPKYLKKKLVTISEFVLYVHILKQKKSSFSSSFSCFHYTFSLYIYIYIYIILILFLYGICNYIYTVHTYSIYSVNPGANPRPLCHSMCAHVCSCWFQWLLRGSAGLAKVLKGIKYFWCILMGTYIGISYCTLNWIAWISAR